MTRFHKRFFIYLSVLAPACSFLIEINGEVSFDMRITDSLAMRANNDENTQKLVKERKKKVKENTLRDNNDEYTQKLVEEVKKKVKDELKEVSILEKEGDNETKGIFHHASLTGVTVAPIVECIYQYPDSEQFNAILSNMMNELTKVFIGVRQLMRRQFARRHQDTRFRVVGERDTRFFERIYKNMTREYSQFYKNTTGRVARAAEDPCDNQEQLKEVWRELLESSLRGLQDAAVGCTEEVIRASHGADQETITRLQEYLEKELAKVRAKQLHMLCDSFQLCYNDLL